MHIMGAVMVPYSCSKKRNIEKLGALLTAATDSRNTCNDNPLSHELGKWPTCSCNRFFLLLFQKDKSSIRSYQKFI